MIGTRHQYCSGDQFEKNEMSRACGTCGDGEVYTWFMMGRAGEEVHLGDRA
jgi:hypothetical protein